VCFFSFFIFPNERRPILTCKCNLVSQMHTFVKTFLPGLVSRHDSLALSKPRIHIRRRPPARFRETYRT
jgi:hypothetical protein